MFAIACCAAAQQQPVFRSQTRLVEVDVVVHDKHGPVTGLTKDDFTLYDCKVISAILITPDSNPPCSSRKQPIAVFLEVKSDSGEAPAVSPLPPGMVSNRVDNSGKPIGTATVVVIDQLNTPFDLKGRQRLELTKFLESAGEHERIAVYSLGRICIFFRTSPAIRKSWLKPSTRIDSGDHLNFDGGTGGDTKIDETEAVVIGCAKKDMTDNAVRAIIQHTAGRSGTKEPAVAFAGILCFLVRRRPNAGHPRPDRCWGRRTLPLIP